MTPFGSVTKLIVNDSPTLEGGRVEFSEDRTELLITNGVRKHLVNLNHVCVTALRLKTDSDPPSVFISVWNEAQGDEDSDVIEEMTLEMEADDEARALMKGIETAVNKLSVDIEENEEVCSDSSSESQDAEDFIASLG